uniref:Uncharacterized protein n=1 Tax=Vespula pensylvanica TaxID=30213 RepID=A0A834P551_VESPE|nr:hypothetical protein H0235_005566 [Vespula pensylvanica]
MSKTTRFPKNQNFSSDHMILQEDTHHPQDHMIGKEVARENVAPPTMETFVSCFLFCVGVWLSLEVAQKS